MTDVRLHAALPSGFWFADEAQTEQFEARGIVNGASKVCLVDLGGDEPRLALRLHPPKNFDSLIRRHPLIGDAAREAGVSGEAGLSWYKDQYNAGYAAGKRGSSLHPSTTHAWDDGFLDARHDRPKWHLSHCVDHDNCGSA